MRTEEEQLAAYKPEEEIRRVYPWARAYLDIEGWPVWGCARVLRSAVGEEMNRILGNLAHADWMGKSADGESKRQARIYYRFTGRQPQVFFWDELAGDHVSVLAGRLQRVRLESRERGTTYCEVRGIRIEQGAAMMGANVNHRYLYRLVSPIFPTDRQWGRRPREEGWARNFYLTDVVSGCIAGLLKGCNLRSYEVKVAPEGLKECRVEWSRPQRGVETWRQGIVGMFSCNVELPSGIAIGRHGAEGYGEVQLVESVQVPRS